MSIYVELTRAFNERRVRAILSSGQAAVVHRLAIMSKDGDWILREDAEATGHVLRELIHANEERLRRHMDAAADWRRAWPELEKQTAGLPLLEAHGLLLERAQRLLPCAP